MMKIKNSIGTKTFTKQNIYGLFHFKCISAKMNVTSSIFLEAESFIKIKYYLPIDFGALVSIYSILTNPQCLSHTTV